MKTDKDMRIVGHARGRAIQRGIPDDVIQAAVLFGKRRRSGRHRAVCTLSPRAVREAQEAGLAITDDDLDVAVVFNELNKTVVSVMRNYRSTRRGDL